MVHRRGGTGELVGRADEFGMLTELVQQIDDPAAPSCVLVTGEAGVGKTRLLSDLADVAASGGVRVLRGACLQLFEALPYGPFVDVLEQIQAEDGAHIVEELAGGWVDGLHAVLPTVGARVHLPAGRARGQQALFQAVATVLAGLSAQRPTLLMIDDLQWADQATVDLLTFVVHRIAGSRVLITGSIRDEGVSDEDPVTLLIASMWRSRRSVTVQLSGLELQDVDVLMSRIGGVAPSASEVARVHELTGGNPLLIEELLAAGFLVDGRGVSVAASWLLGHRLGRLDGDARRVVAAAAVGGARCEQKMLVRVVERASRDGDGVIAALRRAVDVGLLVSLGRHVKFRHALLREAALASLLDAERATLHAAWAATLAELPEPRPATPARLAHHWLAAGDADRALPALLDAAAVAEQRSAHADASRHLEDALDLWDRCIDVVHALDLDRRQVLERAVTAADHGGRRRVAARRLRELIELTTATADRSTLGKMYARLAVLLTDTPMEAIAACERARHLVPAHPASAARTYVLTQEANVRNFLHLPGAVEVGEEALDVARQVGDPRLEAATLVAAAIAPVEVGVLQVDEGIRRLERARALAVQLDDHRTTRRAYVQQSWLLLLDGRLADAHEVARDGMRWAQRVGLQNTGAMILSNAAWLALLLGLWDDGMNLLDLPGWEADAVMEERAALLGEFAVARGDFARADEALRPAFEATSQAGNAETLAFLVRPMAAAHLWQHRPGEALELVARVLRTNGAIAGFFPEMSLLSIGLRASADLRISADARRDRDGVAAALQGASGLVERMARRDGTPMLALERADRMTARAELARLEGHGAAGAWSAAVDAWNEIAVPYEAAYARWRWAEALLAAGGTRRDAADVVQPAVAAARRLGAQPLLASLQALVARARLPAHDPETAAEAQVAQTPFTPLGLTTREEDVLRSVAAGYTNRQIADELFISESTAGVHVSNILRKLNVSNRIQAAAVAHELLTESADG